MTAQSRPRVKLIDHSVAVPATLTLRVELRQPRPSKYVIQIDKPDCTAQEACRVAASVLDAVQLELFDVVAELRGSAP